MKRRWKIMVAVVCICAMLVIIIGMASVWYVLYRPGTKSIGIGSDDVQIYADDNTVLVAAEQLAEYSTHQWALLIHSYRTDRKFMNSYARKYQEKGYNTLQPDNRAHGSSGGTYIGMGYLDQYDIRCWIDYILAKDPDAEIVLHGVSMGGAALMMLSGQEDVPDNVKAIIEDCGYVSATEYLTWKLKQKFHLPAFPVIPIANAAFKIAAGYYMNDASALEGVKNSNIPTLFIHGTDDTTVPVEDVYRLYDVASCPKELYVAEGAGHGQVLMINEEEYWNRVFSFLDHYRM